MLEVSIFATAVAAVAQSAKRPELRSFKEVVQSWQIQVPIASRSS